MNFYFNQSTLKYSYLITTMIHTFNKHLIISLINNKPIIQYSPISQINPFHKCNQTQYLPILHLYNQISLHQINKITHPNNKKVCMKTFLHSLPFQIQNNSLKWILNYLLKKINHNLYTYKILITIIED